MKKIFISLIVVICLVSFAGTQAFAGDKQRHRWEGVAIGVGAAILGHAILSNHYSAESERVTVIYKDQDRCYYPPPRHSRARWEGGKHWVPPVYERVWNPGHFNRHGEWVSGHWITIETQPGYWVKKRGRPHHR